MNTRAIRAVIRKDLKVVTQSKGVMIPLIIVPVMLLVAMPALTALLPMFTDTSSFRLTELDAFIEQMPAGLQAELAGYDELQRIVALVVIYEFAPMYLMVPLMVASVIAADSFAGEKERKTLEALIYTPTTDQELFVAKLLSAWLPAMAVALIGFVLYGVTANVAAWPIMGRLFFPHVMWLVLVTWVAPAVAGLGLSTMVLVSARAQTFQEAYQIGGAIVLPMLLLVVGQATGVMYFSTGLVFVLGLALWAVDVALIRLGRRAFQRETVLIQL
ncbi:MAG TPA: hypothetical protein ENN99_05905 [Chloroflexi bacterium]|nr:hypothetical protein [Chloroflexota bacterium]